MSLSPLILFHRGHGTDHVGRLISSIHQFDFRELEWTHNYIQWLFPLATRSNFNAQAPLLTEEDRVGFYRDPVIRRNFRTSLELVWEFYGFRICETGDLGRTGRWEERRDNWLTPGNHNLLRITRVLRSSMLCGFIEEARIFLDAVLIAAADRPGTVGRSEEFWKTAVATIPAPPEAD
jgi:hypothetical protein